MFHNAAKPAAFPRSQNICIKRTYQSVVDNYINTHPNSSGDP